MLFSKIRVAFAAVLFCTVANVSLAQSYYNSPNDSLMANTALDHAVSMGITQTHPTNDTIHFKWNKLSVSLPLGWDASICDNGACYSSLIDSGMMIPIVPGDNGLMLLHCTPHTISGTAIIRYTLYATNNPSHVDTLTWIVNSTFTGVEELNTSVPRVWYFQNKIHLISGGENFETIRVIDLLGNMIFITSIDNQSEIELPSLLSGICIIELSKNNSAFYQKINLQK